MSWPNPFDDSAALLKPKIIILYAFLGLANLAAWIAAFAVFRDSPTLLGTAFLAYVLGIRHAFDADHIAAIDNVVRKLVQEGKRPLATGFYFSLGHSTVVVFASIAIAAATTAMPDAFERFHSVSGSIGTLVSAAFLLAIGVVNLIVLENLWRLIAQMRDGDRSGADGVEKVLAGRGFFARLLGPFLRAVSRSWHLYPIGFLFGLGFDTATEIGLLGISAAQAAQGLSFWSLMVFPALFTAGMTLVDTTDSVFMTGTYGWAFVRPIRKLWYNFTITAISVVVAFSIGGLEVLGLIADKLELTGPFWTFIGGLADDLGNCGLAVVALFAIGWIVFFAISRRRRYEDLPRSPG